ncbi:MAG: substrate-binding domain-containing protein [Akkermansiaceae bacterium]
MQRIPHRQPLPVQAAEIILEMITSGDLQGILPGERRLAEQLQIGRDTLRGALHILENDNVISPREHGKRRQILSSATRQNKITKRIALLSPKSLVQFPPLSLLEFDILRELLNQRGYELQLVSPKLFHLKNPKRKLEILIKDIDADAWILHQCTGAVQRWFDQESIPSLIRGYPQPGVEIPFIDEDWKAAAFHAGTLLKRNGHQRIGLLMPDTNLAGLKATEEGLREAHPDTDEISPIIPMIEKGTTQSLSAVLARSLRLKHPPTAIVATRSRHALSTFTWMAQQGLSIPKDLSLITLASEPWYEHIFPKPSHYASDPRKLARDILRNILPIVNNKNSRSANKLLIPDYISGETVSSI